MKQKLLGRLAAAAVLLLSATTATAHDFEVDGIYYNKDDWYKTASVTYKGNYYGNYSDRYSGAVTIPSTVTYDGITYSVTSIGWCAFYRCNGLTSVKIPNSVTTIGNQAFWECSLTEIEIPYSVTSIGDEAFFFCSDLKLVNIPNTVTSIGNSAFSGCSGLTSLEIPNAVTSIGNSAFSHCDSLESITVGSGNTLYDSRDNCNALIETTTNTLLCGCKNSIIPNSVTSIGNHAFSGCRNLTLVEIPNSVTSIGNSAFNGCSSLTTLEIPNSVISIGDWAFNGCSGITSVKIPNSVTSMGRDVFYGCSGLTSVEIPYSVTSIGIEAFYGCSGLTSVVIPSSVTSIGSEAFYGCSGLTAVEIPYSVSSIGSSAFWGCSNLKIVLYNATNSQNSSYYVFDNTNCTIVIDKNVKQLPNLVYSAKKIVSHAAVPPVISADTFRSNFKTFVSPDAFSAYWLDDYWGNMSLTEIDTSVASITLNVNDVNIATNCNFQLTYSITPTDATLNDVYWSSDNNKVAFVDQNGLVKGLSNGEATITAMAIDGSGILATCNVTVGEIVAESLELDPSELLISVNKTAVITPIYSPEGISNKEFEWSCSNEDVAKFRNNGDGSITVIGLSNGEATITCRTTDGSDLTATCVVTVATGTGVEDVNSTVVKARGENGVIRIEGADGAAVEVFNAAGVCVFSGVASEIPVAQRGIYVVKVAGRATKIAL